MLSDRFSKYQRPAVGFLRRSFLFVVTTAVLLPLCNCSYRNEEFDPAPLRRTVRRVIRQVRVEDVRRSRQLEELLLAAEVATATEANLPWWEGSVGNTEAAWGRVVTASSRAAKEQRAKRIEIEKGTSGLLPTARDEVARAQQQIRETGMGRKEAAAMEQATNHLDTAKKLVRFGRFASAAKELRSAREKSAVVHKGWTTLHARFSDLKLRQQWERWADETVTDSRRNGTTAIIVDKLKRRVFLYKEGKLLWSCAAELGANGLRRKEKSGDRATPEGKYHVTAAKVPPSTRYFRALLINYPNDEDRMRFALGQARGEISHGAHIGNLIEIHGDGGEGRDWTDGCVALTNADMERLFSYSWVGMPVTIVGTYDR